MPRLLNNLGTERARRGWSQAQAAELAGIGRQSYAAIEAGQAVPSTEVAMRLARGFGRRVEELFRLPEAGSERMRAGWLGSVPPRPGRRVRIGRVSGRPVAVDLGPGERPSRLAAGVVLAAAEEGEVEVSLFADRPAEADLIVAGCDPAFGLVAESLRRDRGLDVCWIPLGSRAALDAVAAERAHVAGAHLRDPGGADFNAALVREVLPFACTRITFSVWEQGLLVAPGNPLGIRLLEDLERPEVEFLNREPGSGSRALLDAELARIGLPAASIRGYAREARSHFAVAEAVAAGLADAGVGIRAAGDALGLGVVPLAKERYELIVPDHFLDLDPVQALLDQLRAPALRDQVAALGGYDVGPMGETR